MDLHLDVMTGVERAIVKDKRAKDARARAEESRANEERRRFMKYIFHEVRTPLNSLSMGIDLLTMIPTLSDSEREPLVMMKTASEFMSDTLDNVLNMHRIEEGKFTLEMAPFSLIESIEKMFCTFRGSVVKKNITLRLHSPPNFPCIIGDSHRIEHVIGNLLSNAIKFSPHSKSIFVEISSEIIAEDLDGRKVANVIMMIKDEGPGISEENQRLLFSSFSQIRPTVLQNGQGSGLGLMFCKEIVHLHGGSISVISAEGQGCTFQWIIPFSLAATCINDKYNNARISLPMLVQPSLLELQDLKSFSTVSLTTPSPRGFVNSNPTHSCDEKVLIVDDSEINRKILTKLLEAKGLHADSAEDGQKAVELISEDLEAYKVIFMDNVMPVMNGMEATRAIRKAGYRYLIVAVTGNVMEDDVEEFLAAGVDIVISKPIRILTLDLLIEHINLYGSSSVPDMYLAQSYGALNWVKRSHALTTKTLSVDLV